MTYVEIYAGIGIELHDQLRPTVRTTTLAIASRWWETSLIYGPDGTLWRPCAADARLRLSLLTRLLAYTLYNPVRDVPMTYRTAGTYTLDDLKRRIAECVDNDDDVLTQFMEAAQIQDGLRRAKDFSTSSGFSAGCRQMTALLARP